MQDNGFRWSLAADLEIISTLPDDWVDADAFEKALFLARAALDFPSQAIRICFPSAKCRTMIDCTAQLLAFVNQPAALGNEVTVDFRMRCQHINASIVLDSLISSAMR
jgi:hypothetical protein